MNNEIGLEEYRALFDQINEGIFILSPKEKNFILVNNRFCELTGYSKAEILKLTIRDTYNESETEFFRERSWRLQKRKNIIIDRSMKRKDGTSFYARISLQLLDNGWEKGIIYNWHSDRDIEERLKRVEEQFEQITEHIRDVFFLVKLPSGNLLYVSPAYEAISGKSARSLLADPTSWLTIVHPDDQKRMLALYQKQLKTGLLDTHCRIINSAQEIRWIHVRTYPIYNDNQQLYRAAGIAEDVSEQKRIEQEREEYSNNLIRGFREMIIAFSIALEKRDAYTVYHQTNVTRLAVAIAKKMKLSNAQLECLEIAAQVHDIGKIGIPIEILTKPSTLSPQEFELLKTHPQVGYDILKNIHFPWPIADIVWQHHERLDGSGYPRGLKGDQIKLEAKILSVADVVDAMSSNRPYRFAPGLKAAIDELGKFRGILYDEKVVDACIKVLSKRKKNSFYALD